jgi:hypothetical protein
MASSISDPAVGRIGKISPRSPEPGHPAGYNYTGTWVRNFTMPQPVTSHDFGYKALPFLSAHTRGFPR